jgi:hypothetical protein
MTELSLVDEKEGEAVIDGKGTSPAGSNTLSKFMSTSQPTPTLTGPAGHLICPLGLETAIAVSIAERISQAGRSMGPPTKERYMMFSKRAYDIASQPIGLSPGWLESDSPTHCRRLRKERQSNRPFTATAPSREEIEDRRIVNARILVSSDKVSMLFRTSFSKLCIFKGKFGAVLSLNTRGGHIRVANNACRKEIKGYTSVCIIYFALG